MKVMIKYDLNNLSRVQRVVLNSIIVGGIVFFSTVTTTDLPTVQNLWSAFVGASLAGLTQLATLTREDKNNKNVPKEYRKEPQPPLLTLV